MENQYTNKIKEILNKLEQKFSFLVNESNDLYASISLCAVKNLELIVEELKMAYKFRMMIDICGVDYPSKEKRFEIVYQFLNIEDNLRLTLKVNVSEDESIPSIIKIHKGACWFEREVFDMYGVMFTGTHDLRRILTDYDFEGFPLRKDFPLTGFTELQYDVTEQKILKKPVNLSQEYRNFDFESPWENVQYEIKKNS